MHKPTRKAWAVIAAAAGSAGMVVAVVMGGLYALDRIDAASDRSAQAQAEMQVKGTGQA